MDPASRVRATRARGHLKEQQPVAGKDTMEDVRFDEDLEAFRKATRSRTESFRLLAALSGAARNAVLAEEEERAAKKEEG